MATRSGDLDRFLRAVHRRWVVVRAVESVGLAVLGGCGLLLIVLPILVWRGGPAMHVVLTTAAVAVTAGIVGGVARRPDLFAAAREADRQLDLADLLSSALVIGQRPGDPWADAVLAAADAQCRTRTANAVTVHRLGGRTWGGIGLSAALALTLGLLSADPNPSQADASPARSSRVQLSDSFHATRNDPAAVNRSASPSHRRTVASADRGERPGDDDASNATSSTDQGDSHRQTAAAAERGGGGLATSTREPAVPQPANAVPQAVPQAGGIDSATAGGGTSAAATGGGDGSAGTSAAQWPAAPPAPAWTSPAWPEARNEAISAVRDGRVSDAYRDLVRAYFDVPDR